MKFCRNERSLGSSDQFQSAKKRPNARWNASRVDQEMRDDQPPVVTPTLAPRTSEVRLVQSLPDAEQRFMVGGSATSNSSFDSLRSDQPIVEAVVVKPGHPALILFTSGSTGRPKGVVLSHEGALFAIDVSRRVFEFQSDDVVLVGKPISHAGGLQTQLLPTLLVGGEVVLASKPTPADAVR